MVGGFSQKNVGWVEEKNKKYEGAISGKISIPHGYPAMRISNRIALSLRMTYLSLWLDNREHFCLTSFVGD